MLWLRCVVNTSVHRVVIFILKGYNDYVSKKIKKPRLSSDGLQVHIDALSDCYPFHGFPCHHLVHLESQLRDCLVLYISTGNILMVIVPVLRQHINRHRYNLIQRKQV